MLTLCILTYLLAALLHLIIFADWKKERLELLDFVYALFWPVHILTALVTVAGFFLTDYLNRKK